MRFDSVDHHSIRVYLRAGTLTVLNCADVRGVGFWRTTRLDPAAVGLMMHDCERETIQNHPILAAGRYWLWGGDQPPDDPFIGEAEAVGASSVGNMLRTTAEVMIDSDGYEARCIGKSPHTTPSSELNCYFGGREYLSSSPPICPSEESFAALNPFLIPPWWDAEMLGYAMLLMLEQSGPPFGKGMTSVFDPPPAKRRTALHKAALEGNMDALPTGRRKLRSANAADTLGSTPLMLAASRGQVEFAARLVELGAALDCQDHAGRTTLHYAAEEGRTPAARALIEAGGDVASTDTYGDTPLHAAAAKGHTETVKLLLTAGAPVDAGDVVYLSTPLHQAVRGGHSEVASALLEAGADPNSPNEAGRTPLHLAAAYGLPDLVSLLIKGGADVDRRDRRKETPLHLPAFYQHLECMRLLIDHGADVVARDSNGNTPLHLAAGMNRDKAARLLMGAGARVEETNGEGMTPLDLAVVNGHVGFFSHDFNLGERYCRGGEHNTEVAEALLENGATIEPTRIRVGDRHVLWPHLTQAHLLYDNGDMNYYRVPDLPEWLRRAMPPERSQERYERPMSQIDIWSSTLLHDAAAKGSSVVVRALLRSGADPMPAVLRCPPPLHLAVQQDKLEIAGMLLERGADVNRPACNAFDSVGFVRPWEVEVVTSFEGKGSLLNWYFFTALDAGVKGGKVEMARFLLERSGAPYARVPELLEQCPEDVRGEMASVLLEYGWLDPALF